METITLYREGGCWMSRSDDPRIELLLGTSVIPTMY